MNLSRGQVLGWTVVLLLTACTVQSGGNDLPENPVAGLNQLFAGDTDGAPHDCDIPAVIDHFSKFFRALNRGETNIAERFFIDGKAKQSASPQSYSTIT